MSSFSTRNYIVFGSLGLGIICLALLIFYRKRLPPAFKWLKFYFLNWIATEIVAMILAKSKLTNLPLLHFYTFLEFIFLSFFFKELLRHRKKVFSNFNRFILFGCILIVVNSLFVQDIFGHNSYAKTFSNLMIITYTLFYTFDLILENKQVNHQPALTWINAGFLIYYMGIFSIYLLTDYLLRQKSELLFDIWRINIGLNYFLIVIVIIGIRKVLHLDPK